MDPHSRFSQFNQRPPKGGPAKQHASSPRPIATNSRVKKDEKLRTDMHLAFVLNALSQKTMGKSEPFDELVNQFEPKQQKPVRSWILALSHVVSRLERTHSALVQAIIDFPWTTLDSSSAKSYTVFIGALVSARPEYLSAVLMRISEGFTLQFGVQALNFSFAEGSSSPITRTMVYDRIHDLLRHMLSLIPTLPSTLMPLLTQHFPHKRQREEAQAIYVRNLLRVSGYCPQLADGILEVIVDRAVKIDVEIQVEIEDLEEAVAETGQDDTVFDLDIDEDSDDEGGEEETFSDLSSEGEDDEDAEDIPTNLSHVHEMTKKLDSILTLVFEHFHRTFESSTTPTTKPVQDLPPLPPLPEYETSPVIPVLPAPTKLSQPTPPLVPVKTPVTLQSQFTTLLRIFDRTVLLTFQSRYTQFLVFFYTSLDPHFSDIFQGMLVERALFPGKSTVTRSAAAAYIGSYVSRAKVVGREDVRNMVGLLCQFLKSYMEEQVNETTVFHSVCQALFLIFCFRWRELQDESGKWMSELAVLKVVVTSTLNPLKACSPNVAAQFAHVAQATNFMYCYTILDANKRSAKGSNRGQEGEELNTFFPFDPYRLPKSGGYVKSGYREWSEVALDGDDSDSEDDEEDDEEEQEQEQGRHLQVQDADEDMLGTSLNAMSISPARGVMHNSIQVST